MCLAGMHATVRYYRLPLRAKQDAGCSGYVYGLGLYTAAPRIWNLVAAAWIDHTARKNYEFQNALADQQRSVFDVNGATHDPPTTSLENALRQAAHITSFCTVFVLSQIERPQEAQPCCVRCFRNILVCRLSGLRVGGAVSRSMVLPSRSLRRSLRLAIMCANTRYLQGRKGGSKESSAKVRKKGREVT
jgi:hypothetical protein